MAPSRVARTERTWRVVVVVLAALGVFLRLDHYFGARSLWVDEMFLVNNLLERNFVELMAPLDFTQVAPLAFLWVEKGFVELLGSGELALRLFPVLAGLASLFLIYTVSLRVAGRHVAVIALGLFALAEFAIYYAAEVKQYSSDMTMTLLVYLATLRYLAASDWRGIGWLVAAGVVGVWFSHPATFVLAGVGMTLGVWYLLRRETHGVLVIGLISATWLVSFAISFLITGSADSEVVSAMREEVWTAAFAPPPTSLQNLRWYVATFLSLFRQAPGGFQLQGVGALAFIAGVVALWRSDRRWLFLLIAPMLVTLAVSAATMYPFTGRLLTFLLPILIIVIACGVEYVRQLLWPRGAVIWGALLGLLVLFPTMNAVLETTRERPYEREDMDRIVRFIERSDEPHDAIYVYSSARIAFDYYAERHGIGGKIIQGAERPGNWPSYASRLQEILEHERLWLVFSHITAPEIEDYLLYRLDEAGTRLEELQVDGGAAYLYHIGHATGRTP